MTPSAPILMLTALAASAAAVATAAPDPALERGRHIAQRDCAGCHAIEAGAKSPRPGAPPFQAIRLRFNPIALEKRMTPMSAQGHFSMPPTTLSSGDVSDLIAYIQTLGPRP